MVNFKERYHLLLRNIHFLRSEPFKKNTPPKTEVENNRRFFDKVSKGILKPKCQKCHSPQKARHSTGTKN